MHQGTHKSVMLKFGLEIDFKAKGGSRVKKTCQAYFVEHIVLVSTLFSECQNSTWF